ncbi:MAG: hypothetical protein PHW96_02440 [Candidatus Nanoarchaeia archaeon]|nr:hypothetical protein [Candidatus Nanoarchaeia archaeon]
MENECSKKPIKKTFENLDELVDYLKEYIDGDIVITDRSGDGTLVDGYIFVNNEILFNGYYTCPNCNLVLGFREIDSINELCTRQGESGLVYSCGICKKESKRVVSERS